MKDNKLCLYMLLSFGLLEKKGIFLSPAYRLVIFIQQNLDVLACLDNLHRISIII